MLQRHCRERFQPLLPSWRFRFPRSPRAHRWKLRYRAWTLPRSQLKSEDQLKAEAKAKMALWDFPRGGA